MDKCPVCACLMKRDLEEAADPYEFLDENFSISGILDNLDKLSPKELKCACCLFGTALQQARKKKKRCMFQGRTASFLGRIIHDSCLSNN